MSNNVMVGVGAWCMVLMIFCLLSIWYDIRITKSYPLAAYGLLALMYPLGKALQVFLIGPAIFRWHLADVGFIASFSYAILVWDRAAKIPPMVWRKPRFYEMYISLFIGSAVAIGYELYTLERGPGTASDGRGDWIDLAIFIVMTPVCLMFLNYVKRTFPYSPEAVAEPATP